HSHPSPKRLTHPAPAPSAPVTRPRPAALRGGSGCATSARGSKGGAAARTQTAIPPGLVAIRVPKIDRAAAPRELTTQSRSAPTTTAPSRNRLFPSVPAGGVHWGNLSLGSMVGIDGFVNDLGTIP